MIVVSDSSPIIALAKADLFPLFYEMFAKVIISQGVYREVVEKGKGKPGAEEVEKAKQQGWLEIKKVHPEERVQDLLVKNMSAVDLESIILAKQIRADFLLIDEGPAKRVAKRLLQGTATTITGVGGFLVLAKFEHKIEKIGPILAKMRAKGIWLSDEDYDKIVKLAGE